MTALLLAGCSTPHGAEAHPVTACNGDAEFDACLERAFGGLAASQGIPAAMQDLDAAAAVDRRVALAQHQVEHAIGWSGLQAGADPRQALQQCPTAMLSGCVHGVLEAYFAQFAGITAEDLAGLCNALGDAGHRPSARDSDCWHGLGHGLDMVANLDWQQALAWCKLVSGAQERSLCASGVFMQNAMAQDDHAMAGPPGAHVHGPAAQRFRTDDLAYPCNLVTQPDASQCWATQPALVLQATHGDWNRTMASCSAAGHSAAICFAGIGREVAAVVLDEARAIVALCLEAPVAFRGDCIGGAAMSAAIVHSSLRPGIMICGQAPVETKGECYDAVGVVNRGDPDPERREQACRDVPDEYRDRCLSRP